MLGAGLGAENALQGGDEEGAQAQSTPADQKPSPTAPDIDAVSHPGGDDDDMIDIPEPVEGVIGAEEHCVDHATRVSNLVTPNISDA